MKSVARYIPVVLMVLCLMWLAGKAVPPRDTEGTFAVQSFSRLPVVYNGRVKPFDTLARNSLIVISDRQTWRDGTGTKRQAIEWLLDVMSNSPRAHEHKVFRIHNHELLTQMGLESRRGYRYAFNEFEEHLGTIEQQAAHAAQLEPEQRDVYDIKVLEFRRRVVLYRVLGETHLLP
jgi:hypothetical protein